MSERSTSKLRAAPSLLCVTIVTGYQNLVKTYTGLSVAALDLRNSASESDMLKINKTAIKHHDHHNCLKTTMSETGECIFTILKQMNDICLYKYIHIHTYTYIHIHTDTYRYTHTHTHTQYIYLSTQII